MNRKLKQQDPARIANQAVRYVKSNPCCICSWEGACGVKYKGTCQIARFIRFSLYSGQEIKEKRDD